MKMPAHWRYLTVKNDSLKNNFDGYDLSNIYLHIITIIQYILLLTQPIGICYM